MGISTFSVPLSTIIVNAIAGIGPSCNSILRSLRGQAICHVKLIDLMIPCKYVIDEALDKVSVALAEMLEVTQVSLSFTVCAISPPWEVHEVLVFIFSLVYVLIILMLVVQPRVHLESWRES